MLGRILIGAIRFYRSAISPWTPPSCRYQPTCSAFALEAIERHGAARGSLLAAKRIGRCHPWGGYGFDPVPPTGTLSQGASGSETSPAPDVSGSPSRSGR